MNNKGQLEFDELNIVGVLFALIGAAVGFLVAFKMGSGIFMRFMAAIVSAVACYFVGGKIANG